MKGRQSLHLKVAKPLYLHRDRDARPARVLLAAELVDVRPERGVRREVQVGHRELLLVQLLEKSEHEVHIRPARGCTPGRESVRAHGRVRWRRGVRAGAYSLIPSPPLHRRSQSPSSADIFCTVSRLLCRSSAGVGPRSGSSSPAPPMHNGRDCRHDARWVGRLLPVVNLIRRRVRGALGRWVLAGEPSQPGRPPPDPASPSSLPELAGGAGCVLVPAAGGVFLSPPINMEPG